MKWNRARWSGLAALALVGGLLTPVAMAPSANAAQIGTASLNLKAPNPSCDSGIQNTFELTVLDGTLVGTDTWEFTGSASDTIAFSTTCPSTGDMLWLQQGSNEYGPFDNSTPPFSLRIGDGTIELKWGSGTGASQIGLISKAPTPPTPPTPPNPPTPTPATPPSAPTSAEAAAGNGEVTVTWQAPTSQGSFPVTNYQVQSTPSSRGCVVPVSTTSCRIVGLRNGTAYTFQVRALNGGGWGSWATTSAVTPGPGPDPDASIMITGSRSANERVARVRGETTGLVGASVQSMVRLSDRVEFTSGTTRVVGVDGRFAWQRRVSTQANLEVYFTAGQVQSNTVTIPSNR